MGAKTHARCLATTQTNEPAMSETEIKRRKRIKNPSPRSIEEVCRVFERCGVKVKSFWAEPDGSWGLDAATNDLKSIEDEIRAWEQANAR